MSRLTFEKGLRLAVQSHTDSSRERNLKSRESIQLAEEERGDALKIEIIDIHHNHGLACFPTDKKGQQFPQWDIFWFELFRNKQKNNNAFK